MGKDVVLESGNCLQEIPRPRNVCASTIGTDVEDKHCNSKLDTRYCISNNFVGEPRVLHRRHSLSPNCKCMPSEIIEDARDTNVLQRGSMYLSTEEARRIMKDREERRKVESACSTEAYISFELGNSSPRLHSNDTILLQRHSPPATSYSDKKPSTESIEFPDLSFRDLANKLISPSRLVSVEDDISDIFLLAGDSISQKATVLEMLKPETSEEQESECDQKYNCQSTTRILYDEDTPYIVPKSHQTKVGISTVPSLLKDGLIDANSTTARLHQIKKLFGPIRMSRSQRNLLLVESETTGSAYTDDENIMKNELKSNTLIRDVLRYFSLPEHLQGILKLETSSGNPSFKFSVKDTEDELSAMTWRTDNVSNWVYTFHSSRERIQSTCKSSKGKNDHSPTKVGEMPVYCYLCSEIQDNGSIENSIITEFTLYDVLQGRWSFYSEENSTCSSETNSTEQKNLMECQLPIRHAFDSHNSDVSTSYPCLPEDLHPDLEIASIVVQTPFEKKDRFKRLKDEARPKDWTELLSSPGDVNQEGKTTSSSLSSTTVKVIAPSEKHGLPNYGVEGPSTLLNRWRYGGSCDCGGWDMGCPLDLFENAHADYWSKDSSSSTGKPILLFGKGSKEKMPALAIMADGQGQYLVDFHARFLPLQAFSICIAILHGSESPTALSQEKNGPTLYSNPLKSLLGEKVRQMTEQLAVEETPKVPEASCSFFLDPPFSPVARV